MTSTGISKSAFIALIVGGISLTGAASAGQPDTMQDWQSAADKSISKAMSVPTLTNRQGSSGYAQFAVTVNRDGEVINSTQTIRARNSGLNNAALRAVRRVDFPALPESYDAEQLTFTLNLDYQSSSGVSGLKRLRTGNVEVATGR